MAISSKQFGSQFIENVEDMISHPEKYKGWRSGLPDLDRITGGILRKRFYVVGGKQKDGKSALLLTLVINLNKQGVKTLYISLEMDNLEIAGRVFSNMSAIDMTKLRDVTVNAADLAAMKRAQEVIDQFPGYWDYGTSNMEDIIKLVDEIQPDVLVVDYFNLMESHGDNRQEGLAKLSHRLKGLTIRKNKVSPTVIVAAQVNRASIRAGLFDANSLLDTGALERDGDVILMIMTIKDDAGEEVSNRRKIKVVASRVSGNGEVDVFFNGARSLMASSIPQGTSVRELWYNS